MKKNGNKNRKINIYKVKSTKCAEVEKCIRLGVQLINIFFILHYSYRSRL